MPTVHLLDYVAGNVRSLANAIEKLGYQIKWVKRPEELEDVEVGLQRTFRRGIWPPGLVGCIYVETHRARRWPFRPLSQQI